MVSIPELNGPVVKPASGGIAKQLIVFLHGLGADGNDLIGLAGEFESDFPDAQFVSPHAPYPCDMAPFGFQWFSLQERSVELMLEGVRNAEPALNRYLDAQLEALGLTDENLAVIGFSQGTMTALHTMLRRPEACGAIVGFSGALLDDGGLEDDITCKPPICLIHGQADMVVPFGAMPAAKEALVECGIQVETLARPALGHGIDPQGLDFAIRFLKEHLV